MRSPTSTTLLLLLTTLTTPALSWGSLGHRTVAYLSTLYFSPTSQHFTNTLLHGQDISEAALFPDKVAHIPSFAFSRPWHYIDAKDSPPHECGLNMTRDCAVASGCVVTAIANHTARVVDPSLPSFLRGQSLRFMMHFFGDIHQPLHTEAEDRGGNGIEVMFGGKRTNLHSVWDSLMPNKYRKREEWGGGGRDSEEEAAFLWAQELYASDEHKDDLSQECKDDAAACALEWAGEANKWVCEYVLKDDVDGVQGIDLAGDYYDGAVPVIDEMIRKGGRRLGVWIDRLAAHWEEGGRDIFDLEVQEL
jgi:S1/P1 Nuclease